MFHEFRLKPLIFLLAFFSAVLGGRAQDSGKSGQMPDGKIIFSAADAELAGASLSRNTDGAAAQIGNWKDGDSVSWNYKPSRWGTYLVVVTYSFERVEPGSEIEVELPGKKLSFDPAAGPVSDSIAMKSLDTWYLAKGDPFTVKISAKKVNPAAKFKLRELSLQPAMEGPMPRQDGAGAIALKASQAITHSVTMRYEPAEVKNCLGYWVNPSDWAEWQFEVKTPGAYDLQVLQGCGKGNGGSDVEVFVDAREPKAFAPKRFEFVVEETGHFQIFLPRKVGTVDFAKPGLYTLAIKPKRKQASAIMDVRQVNLIPANENPEKSGAVESLNGRKVLVLGDSITYGGEYVEMVEAYLRMRYPGLQVDILNVGLPSETVSGLSEDGHAGGAFPRPDLHERLDRVLAKTKPDIILACYGMNDGIYLPLDEARFKAFRDGIEKLRAKAQAAGAEIVHLTPPVFDSKASKGGKFPYELAPDDYDRVLDRYSKWLLDQRANGWEVLDLHGPMRRFLDEQRKTNPEYRFAGDGVHANTQGNWIMARVILRGLDASRDITQSPTPDILQTLHPRAKEIISLIQQRQRERRDSWLHDIGHKRPGMSNGKPLQEAEQNAALIETKLKALIRNDLPGKRSVWNGFDMFEFEVNGKPVMVVAPKTPAPGKPWVWHGEFFGHKPNPDIALLGRGFHVVSLGVPNLLGSPVAVQYWNELYAE
jgi:lysophospholipase L1-like esterase